MKKKSYFTFPTTYQAIKAEKVLLERKWKYKMVPVPRSISSSCGLALSCSPGDALAIKDYLKESSVVVEGFFELEEKVSKSKLSFFKRREQQ